MSNGSSTRLRATCLLVVALGCSSREQMSNASTSDAGCRIARQIEVPRDLLASDREALRITPFGSRFALLESSFVTTTRTADVVVVSWRGVDQQHRFVLDGLCPDDVCRNVHGVALLDSAAGTPEFLLAEQGSSVSMAAYPLRILAWNTDKSEPVATPLFDARVGAITTRSDMKSSKDARRALFVSGNVDTPSLQMVLLSEHGAAVAPASVMTLPSAPWECLTVVPTEGAGAISLVARAESGTELTWSLRELGVDADVVFDAATVVPVGDALGYGDCPKVVESPQGFHAQWSSAIGGSVVATLKRNLDVAQTASLFWFDVDPGALEGRLGDDLLFRATLSAERTGLVRADSQGTLNATLRTLSPLAANPAVLAVAGPLVSWSYELENERVFEQLECP